MIYAILVPIIVLSHFAYLAYVVLGGFLIWRWPVAFWPHLAATTWGVLLIAFSLDCPLTGAERWARERAGKPVPTSGFMDRYIEGIIYPAHYTNQIRAACAVTVIASWLIGYLRWRTHQQPIAMP